MSDDRSNSEFVGHQQKKMINRRKDSEKEREREETRKERETMYIASLDEKRTRPSWTHPIRESALAPSRWVWILSLHPFDGPKKNNK